MALDGRWCGWVSSFFVRYEDGLFTLDWTLAIDRHRDALVRMVAALLVMAGGGEAMPRHVRTGIWRVLRPAEAAFRRLVVVVKLVLKIEAGVRVSRGGPVAVIAGVSQGVARVPAFALFDARKSFKPRSAWRGRRPQPNIRFFDEVQVFEPVTVASPDDEVSPAQLMRRLQALQSALGDVPKQARRLARWEAKREAARAETGKYIAPIRPGKPPGHRDRGRHPVDFVLKDCHALALYALHDPPDTG